MAERRENSVLFSLKELRQIEDQRVKEEGDAEKSRVESERKAKEDEERRAAEEVERKRREEEDRVLKMQQDHARQLREEQQQLEAQKHKATMDAQAQVEAARIQAELHAQAVAKKAPVGAILGIVGAVVLLAGGTLGYVFKVVIPEQKAQQAAENERAMKIAANKAKADLEEALAAAAAQSKKELDAIQADFERKMKNATTAEDRAKIQAEADQRRAESKKKEKDVADKAAIKKKQFKVNCDPNDPLCGSGL